MDKEKPKKKGYINKLQERVAQLEGELKVREEKTEKELVQEKSDLDDIVEVSYGVKGHNERRQVVYHTYKLPKKEALEALVQYYSVKVGSNRAVPAPNEIYPHINSATIYCRITKRDVSTGRRMIAVKDLPLWIAAERALEGKLIEPISKVEHDKFYEEKDKQFEEWRKSNNEMIRQAAMKSLINLG